MDLVQSKKLDLEPRNQPLSEGQSKRDKMGMKISGEQFNGVRRKPCCSEDYVCQFYSEILIYIYCIHCYISYLFVSVCLFSFLFLSHWRAG